MTSKRDLKSITRERQRKTGESYTAARVHVMRERAHLLGIPDESSSITRHASEAPAPEAPATEPLALGCRPPSCWPWRRRLLGHRRASKRSY